MKRIIVAVLAFLPAVASGPDPVSVLRRAVGAAQTVAYVGGEEIRVWSGGQPVVAEVRVAADGRGRTRREHVSGPSAGLVVMSADGWEWRRAGNQPWRRTVSLGHGDLGLDAADLARLEANYRLEVGDGELVAGRATTVVTVTPKHRGRPSRRLWLDRDTGLALATEAHNCEGHLVSRSRWRRLELARPPAADVTPPPGLPEDPLPFGCLRRVASRAKLEQLTGRQLPLPAVLPDGFAVHSYYARACRRGGFNAVVTYRDGLDLITLFERGTNAGQRGYGGPGGPCRVTTNVLQTVVTVTAQGREWLVIGDLGQRELEPMARSMAAQP